MTLLAPPVRGPRSIEPNSLPSDRSSKDGHEDLLGRILEAVERQKRQRGPEIVAAIVMSLATVGSAWCAYQATLWGGVQAFRLGAANAAGREASKLSIQAVQARAFDASMFVSYIEARGRQDDRVADFLSQRFRPEMSRAFEAWLRTDPIHNVDAPKSPLQMSEYVQAAVLESERKDAEAANLIAEGQQANHNADRYVLLTVLFASTLFFGGIAGMVESRRLKMIVFCVSVALFLGTMTALAMMPVCRD